MTSLSRGKALFVLGAISTAAACNFSYSSTPRAPPQNPQQAQQAQQTRYVQQRYANGQYVPPAAPPPQPMRSLAHVQQTAALALPPPLPVKAPSPTPLPAGWTTVGGVAVPTLQTLLAGNGGLAMPPGFQVPNVSALAGKHCGAANVRGKRVPLDCMTPTYGLISWAQRPVVKRGFIEGPPGAIGGTQLPLTVDNRAAGLESPIRDQGTAGTCTAVSFAAAIDHAVGRVNGRAAMVSSMHVWSHYHSPTMEDAASANRAHNLATEALWPYQANEACSWTNPCERGDCNAGVSCGLNPSSQEIALAESQPFVQVSNITALDTGDIDSFRSVLAKGQDIWFAMFVDDAFSEIHGRDAIVPDGDFSNTASGHALVIAGYKTQANGTYYLLHNSWGTDWGDNGYGWIHESTLRRNIRSAYVVEAHALGAPPPPTPQQPARVAPPPPPAPTPPGGRAACTSGLPDSTTGECVPVCPDGSPRANGVCAANVPGQCGPGQINLFGVCIMGAPPKSPTVDPVSGVKVMCAPGGCTYFMVFGQQGCNQAVCTQSCPAPKFVLTSGPNGLACSE